MVYKKILLFVLFVPFAVLIAENKVEKPQIMQAKKWQQELNVQDYFVSEKLDGIRGYWNGEQLISRGGKILAAPLWFIKNFPETALDGELWIARGLYEKVSSVVRKQKPHKQWEKVKFMIFDIPTHKGKFAERVQAMQKIIKQAQSPYLEMIPQKEMSSAAELEKYFYEVVNSDGEGLMLHKKDAFYRSGRSGDLRKFKLFEDSEATVIGYKKGKGKYKGKVGALQVQLPEGKKIFIGSGLKDIERKNPPPIGSIITFKYQGYTKNGIPRFPVFLRIRNEEPQ